MVLRLNVFKELIPGGFNPGCQFKRLTWNLSFRVVFGGLRFLVCSVVVLPCSLRGGVGAGVVFGVWAAGAGFGSLERVLLAPPLLPWLSQIRRRLLLCWAGHAYDRDLAVFSPSLRLTCLPLTSIQI
jgi:hypothetical protein